MVFSSSPYLAHEVADVEHEGDLYRTVPRNLEICGLLAADNRLPEVVYRPSLPEVPGHR